MRGGVVALPNFLSLSLSLHQTQCDLFDKLVVPILLYQNEVLHNHEQIAIAQPYQMDSSTHLSNTPVRFQVYSDKSGYYIFLSMSIAPIVSV